MVQSLSASSSSLPPEGLSSLSSTRLGGTADVSTIQTSVVDLPAKSAAQVVDTEGAADSAVYEATSLERALKEKDVLKFARHANRLPVPYDTPRVEALRSQLSQEGGVAKYLGQVDWNRVSNNISEELSGLFPSKV
jgi:pyruvate dehydrogenase complex dehydrogenase (E1) component